MGIKQKFNRQFRHAIDHLWQGYEKHFLEHIRYNHIKLSTLYRHRRSMQYFRTAIFSALIAYAASNFFEIQNHENFLGSTYFMTQYSKLVKDVRADKNNEEAYKVAYDIIQKSKEIDLTPLEILSLSELVKKPELNLHAEYIASLK